MTQAEDTPGGWSLLRESLGLADHRSQPGPGHRASPWDLDAPLLSGCYISLRCGIRVGKSPQSIPHPLAKLLEPVHDDVDLPSWRSGIR